MEGGIKATAMLAIGERSQHFVKERAMNFFKIATEISSFLYCSFYKLKQLCPILKMLQRRNFKRNIIILEITKSS